MRIAELQATNYFRCQAAFIEWLLSVSLPLLRDFIGARLPPFVFCAALGDTLFGFWQRLFVWRRLSRFNREWSAVGQHWQRPAHHQNLPAGENDGFVKIQASFAILDAPVPPAEQRFNFPVPIPHYRVCLGWRQAPKAARFRAVALFATHDETVVLGAAQIVRDAYRTSRARPAIERDGAAEDGPFSDRFRQQGNGPPQQPRRVLYWQIIR